MTEMKDFNNIKQWLLPMLDKRGLSVEQLATAAELNRSAIYHYLIDRCRPTEQNMIKICHVLNVPVEEGLSQYTPRKAGRRPGFRPATKTVTVRSDQ